MLLNLKGVCSLIFRFWALLCLKPPLRVGIRQEPHRSVFLVAITYILLKNVIQTL